jgi:hypothetical protein
MDGPRDNPEQKWDMLSGFYGPKLNHDCQSSYCIFIGEGDSRYENILTAFRSDRMGGFSWVNG